LPKSRSRDRAPFACRVASWEDVENDKTRFLSLCIGFGEATAFQASLKTEKEDDPEASPGAANFFFSRNGKGSLPCRFGPRHTTVTIYPKILAFGTKFIRDPARTRRIARIRKPIGTLQSEQDNTHSLRCLLIMLGGVD
jgi:hypothetical protein